MVNSSQGTRNTESLCEAPRCAKHVSPCYAQPNLLMASPAIHKEHLLTAVAPAIHKEHLLTAVASAIPRELDACLRHETTKVSSHTQLATEWKLCSNLMQLEQA